MLFYLNYGNDFLSNSGVWIHTEGSSNLSAAGRNVDVDDAAVRAFGSNMRQAQLHTNSVQM